MTLSERYDRWWDALDDAVNFRDERFDVDKVMAVADAEQAELRAENKYLWGVLEAVACDCDDYDGWHPTHEVSQLKVRIGRAERALADERAKVARVEALIPPDPELIEAGYGVLAEDLLDALAGPEPDTTSDGAP
jgi:hypothetical protein